MLSSFIMNGLDMFNIIYLWAILSNKRDNKLKLLISILGTTILTTIIEHLDVNFIITYINIIIIIIIIYKIALKDALWGFFLVLLIDMSMQLILFIFINKLVYNDTFVKIITEMIILISIIAFSRTNLSRNITFKSIDNNILIYFVLICVVYASVFKIIWNYDSRIILNNLFITSAILSVLVISQILTYLYVVKLAREKVKLKVSNEYNSVIDEIVQEIKQRQHDFENYKNTIKGIVNVVDEDEIKDAINNYIKDEDLYDDRINALIYIDNVVIRSIIYRNMCKFKKSDIDFHYEIENDVLDNILSYHEISNVLNNLLNNAFEEVLKEECIKKYIEIKIFNEDKVSHLMLKNQIANTSDINLNNMFIRGYSTKDTGTRGYGLYNIQTIINLHKGYIKVNIESGEIIFDIYFKN